MRAERHKMEMQVRHCGVAGISHGPKRVACPDHVTHFDRNATSLKVRVER